MNKDTIEGNSSELKGKAKQQWGKLTDDRLDEIVAGRRDESWQARFSRPTVFLERKADKQVKDFEESYQALTLDRPRHRLETACDPASQAVRICRR